ncbi:Bromodomain adjacent to zinc finger domain protein 2A [Tetrabaena socialis]|uniref:Bromodomain adjacent to zinc finger domain protein 2A n=1 Tax=Tetrabaena socialis TaxID=47790 RepID=A0A2J7ZIZ1_9CHLO|nr:Bromodomain adjacent to zinc finger domain protein 2A [Tetrabaena socialis]|eukprot:PNH00233.1 Bromodomain adjacent to zinc finger domain protein 2A [Tetrabaena socialis]
MPQPERVYVAGYARAVTSPDDALLKQLLLNGKRVYDWDRQLVQAAKDGKVTAGVRHGLSQQCQSDFEVTCFGTVALVRTYLRNGGKGVVMASLNQNSVENSFSQLRGHGQNRTPDAQHVMNGEQSLRTNAVLQVINNASSAVGKLNTNYELAADGDGSHRRSFDAEVLEALQIGQTTIANAELTSFFMGLHQELMTRVPSASSVLRSGPFAVRRWVQDLRCNTQAWQGFRRVCLGAGVDSLLFRQATLSPEELQRQVDEQLRGIMGVLVRKYAHANLLGLLKHTQLLVAKDRAETQTLRGQCQADAARGAKGKVKAAPKRTVAARAKKGPGGVDSGGDDGDQLCSEDLVCEFCSSPEHDESLLLCDTCNRGWHTFCLLPRLDRVPDGNWFCQQCLGQCAPRAAAATAAAPAAAPTAAPAAAAVVVATGGGGGEAAAVRTKRWRALPAAPPPSGGPTAAPAQRLPVMEQAGGQRPRRGGVRAPARYEA